MNRHASRMKTRDASERRSGSPRENSYSGESSPKGKGCHLFVTYDIRERKGAGGMTLSPKVKSVYIAGDIISWQFGSMRRKSGRVVHGIQISYEMGRTAYLHGPGASRNGQDNNRKRRKILTRRQMVEMPEDARNVQLYADQDQMPEKYRAALEQAEEPVSRGKA